MTESVQSVSILSEAPVAEATLGHVLAGLSKRMSASRIGTGMLAELRRIADDQLPPAFWRLYLNDSVIPQSWRAPNGYPSSDVDMAWATVIRAMVEMTPNPHSFEVRFGKALGESGYSEARFVRLVRAEGSSLRRELRVAAAWLAGKGVLRADWRYPASLVLGSTRLPGVYRKSSIHQLSRDFFSAEAQRS